MENMSFNIVGFIMATIAIGHEWTWWQCQRHCVRLVGQIVGEVEDDKEVDTRWKIEYIYGGVTRQFTSMYAGSSTMQIGDDAKVILDLRSDIAEHLTWSNRWILTLGPMLLAIIFILAGVFQ
jgi:hypothetical protein